ncbi:flagellar biosynthesis protein FlgM [Crocosphaera sp. UHCC 0190]|uniref:flagellar biosynthesis protein FlgM n=1 Tax=Crocosphaera sp. UHCC 0190 TaxID=3110246 RepID=UPI002B203BDE|nr:flagellar biosynthesis protein FlgM [Crocosphaera sp. UHCC 0190]MEA5510693.1 flagellar biosynthesis protein FlgM [Crocosphaera sp. UHCC 0190]
MDLTQEKINHWLIPRQRNILRPGTDQVPTQILVGIYTLDLAKINEVEQTFYIDFYLGLQWHDPRLDPQLYNQSLPIYQRNLDEVWHPNIHIINQRQLTKELDEIVHVNPEGIVTYRQRFYGELATTLDLKRFPFDEQLIKIELISFSYSPEEINFLGADALNGINNEISLVNWSVQDISTHIHSHYIQPEQRNYAQFDYQIKVKRYSSFYAWRVLLPVALIVFMSDLVFWLEPSQIIPQITLATATMVSLITYQFVLRQELPRMAYLTAEDKVIVGSMLLVFLALIESVTSINLVAEGYHDLALSLDAMLRWLVPLLFTALAAFAFWV